LAHSISLGLTTYGLIVPKSNLVESIIALSIVYTAIENIVRTKLSKWRLIIIFCFGLIHGMGFASALKDAGISQNYFIQSLLGFNIGVEMGQILVIIITYIVLVRSFANKVWYQTKVVYPISSLIACLGIFWVIIRFMA
jgi:hydrogenase/urease accessory protein HupE